MPLIWPPNSDFQIRLYAGNRLDPSDVLIIAIDDDGGLSFTNSIEGILTQCHTSNSTMTFWVLHIAIQNFNEVLTQTVAVNFQDSIYKFIINKINELRNIEIKNTIVRTLDNFRRTLLPSLVKAPIKIWFIDVKDGNDNHKDSLEIINTLHLKNANLVTISQHGQTHNDILVNELDYLRERSISKQINLSEAYYEDIYERAIKPFIPSLSLSEIEPAVWHQLRFNCSRSHLFEGKAPWHFRDDYPINSDALWKGLEKLNINCCTNLKDFLKEYGYYEDCPQEFTSNSVLYPSIEALLSPNFRPTNNNEYLCYYLNLCKEKLAEYGKDKEIVIELKNTIILNSPYNCLWFNVVAMYHSFLNIIDNYSTYHQNGQGSNIIIDIDQSNNSLGIYIKIKENNIVVDNPRWPYSSSGGEDIHDNTKDFLKYIKKQGVKKVLYKVNDNKGNTVKLKAIFKDNEWAGSPEDLNDAEDFTFKWFIPAFPTKDPYGYDNNDRKSRWSCYTRE